jgi:hypothetical protein
LKIFVNLLHALEFKKYFYLQNIISSHSNDILLTLRKTIPMFSNVFHEICMVYFMTIWCNSPINIFNRSVHRYMEIVSNQNSKGCKSGDRCKVDITVTYTWRWRWCIQLYTMYEGARLTTLRDLMPTSQSHLPSPISHPAHSPRT